jgi:cytidylate kinase
MSDQMKHPLPARVEHRIDAHIALAQRMKGKRAGEAEAPAPFLTLSRQYGCEAMVLAEHLARRLATLEKLAEDSWQVYSRQIIDSISQELPLADRLLEALDVRARGGIEEFFQGLIAQSPPDIEVLRHLVRTVRAAALHGRCIVVGRGGAVLTRDLPGGIHLRLVAPEEWRLENLIARFGWDRAKARAVLRDEEHTHHAFFAKYLGQDTSKAEYYDLMLNSARLSQEEQVEAVLAVFRRRFPHLK